MVEYNISAKEYSFTELLSHSWRLYTENFIQIALIVLAVYLPINFFTAATAAWAPAYAFFAVLFGMLFGVIAVMAVAFLINKKLNKENAEYVAALGKALSRWPIALFAMILKGILLIILFLLLIIPGILYSVYWTFVIYAVVLHDKGASASLGYSEAIVKKRWWKVFGISLALGIITLVAVIILGFVSSAVGVFLSLVLPQGIIREFMQVTVNTVFPVLNNLIMAFNIVATTLLFLNLEATKRPEKSAQPAAQTELKPAVEETKEATKPETKTEIKFLPAPKQAQVQKPFERRSVQKSVEVSETSRLEKPKTTKPKKRG